MVLGLGVNWDWVSNGIPGSEVTYMHELFHIVLAYMIYTSQFLIIVRHLLKVTYACLASRSNKALTILTLPVVESLINPTRAHNPQPIHINTTSRSKIIYARS